MPFSSRSMAGPLTTWISASCASGTCVLPSMVGNRKRPHFSDRDVHVAVQHAVLVAQHGGTAHNLDLGQLCERHLCLAVHGRHQDAPQFVRIAAVIPHVPYVDGIAFAALDSRADVLAADSAHDYVLSVVNTQTVARQLVAIPLEIEEVAAT